MDENYKHKYEKYKSKYLDLKNDNNINGGFIPHSTQSRPKPNDCTKKHGVKFSEIVKDNWYIARNTVNCITVSGSTRPIIPEKIFSIKINLTNENLCLEYLGRELCIDKKNQRTYMTPGYLILKTYYADFMNLFNDAKKKRPDLFTDDWKKILDSLYSEDIVINVLTNTENKHWICIGGKDYYPVCAGFELCESNPKELCLNLHVLTMEARYIHKHYKLIVSDGTSKIDRISKNYETINSYLMENPNIQEKLLKHIENIINDYVKKGKITSAQKELIMPNVKQLLKIEEKKKKIFKLFSK